MFLVHTLLAARLSQHWQVGSYCWHVAVFSFVVLLFDQLYINMIRSEANTPLKVEDRSKVVLLCWFYVFFTPWYAKRSEILSAEHGPTFLSFLNCHARLPHRHASGLSSWTKNVHVTAFYLRGMLATPHVPLLLFFSLSSSVFCDHKLLNPIWVLS